MFPWSKHARYSETLSPLICPSTSTSTCPPHPPLLLKLLLNPPLLAPSTTISQLKHVKDTDTKKAFYKALTKQSVSCDTPIFQRLHDQLQGKKYMPTIFCTHSKLWNHIHLTKNSPRNYDTNRPLLTHTYCRNIPCLPHQSSLYVPLYVRSTPPTHNAAPPKCPRYSARRFESRPVGKTNGQ